MKHPVTWGQLLAATCSLLSHSKPSPRSKWTRPGLSEGGYYLPLHYFPVSLSLYLLLPKASVLQRLLQPAAWLLLFTSCWQEPWPSTLFTSFRAASTFCKVSNYRIRSGKLTFHSSWHVLRNRFVSYCILGMDSISWGLPAPSGPWGDRLQAGRRMHLHIYPLFWALRGEKAKYYFEESVYESLISHCHQLAQKKRSSSTKPSSEPIRWRGQEQVELQLTTPVREGQAGIKPTKCRKEGLLSAGWSYLLTGTIFMLEPAFTPLPAIANKASEVTGHYHVTPPMIFQATPRLPGQGSTKQPVQTFPGKTSDRWRELARLHSLGNTKRSFSEWEVISSFTKLKLQISLKRVK